ncbi:hypothetical protein D7231_14850 [Streptomyces klenkii]|uniref:Uncharacterized protein n=1 Tax=Streptomyces klenkii TaxID=1420899 RepID=A0A3B0BJ90_9ACTN|nr:hypothetical protein [Streptomyces klenkii]RKN72742.1 hypothetical protein D7231_14850 [Streptomyces klenkii]
MLEATLAALAAAGGSAVVQAAGTDAWAGFRQAVARLFGRGDAQREHAELERLDQTAAALDGVIADEAERARVRQEASWQTRFEALLESLDGTGREQVATELRALLVEQGATAAASAGPGGVAAGRAVNIRADGGIAAAVIHGGAHLGTPRPPGPSQG